MLNHMGSVNDRRPRRIARALASASARADADDRRRSLSRSRAPNMGATPSPPRGIVTTDRFIFAPSSLLAFRRAKRAPVSPDAARERTSANPRA